MRSLIVTDSRIWTAEAEYAMAVACAERDNGWEVTFAAPPGDAALRAAAEGLNTVRLPGEDPVRSPADFLADVRFLSGLMRDRSHDVVHSSRSAPHLACALAGREGASLVHLRGGARRPRAGPLNRFLYGRLTDLVIVSSERIRDWVTTGLRVPSDRVRRLHAPVDVRRFAEASRKPGTRLDIGVPADARLVVNVARIAPIKGQHVLVRAMSRVVADHPDAVLLLVGEAWSGEPEGVLGLARALGIEGAVVATGAIDDVPALLREADVCVSSSLGSEENSRAVSEYMAAGRPLVATRVGVVPELVSDGETGLLVEPGDPDRLGEAVSELLGSPERASELGVKAARFARSRLSGEAFAEGLDRALASAGAWR
ncbi:MAG: glycosyltransferase [Candidatus Eisenbacteria bacterium]|nr:glycosyltransferase [Candidatus Eisenbacteria bacterium]